MYESQDYVIPIIWEGDGTHPSPNYGVRDDEYNVMALPSTAIDGDTFDLGGGTGVLGRYLNLYGNRVLVDSPMEIDVLLDVNNEGMTEITADVLMTDDIPATEEYRIILLLTYSYSDSYNSTVINYHEEDFDLSANGESQQFVQEFELDAGMDMALTRAVVLVQYVNTTGVFIVGNYTQYPFNMYPILQAGIATYALEAYYPPENVMVNEDTGLLSWDEPVAPYELDRELTGYNVYLDGEMVAGNISETEFLLENLVHGLLYTAGVAAVYDGGTSTIAEVEFTYSGTGADDGIVLRTELHSNYPNPFNPTTTISYSLKNDSKVTLEIYNIRVQLVRTLINDIMEAGPQEATWNGRDDSDKRVGSGVYFYKLNAGDYTSTKKMILLK
jgi:type IX secretion system substrate protein